MSKSLTNEELVEKIISWQKTAPNYLVCDASTDHRKLAEDWISKKRDQDRLRLMEIHLGKLKGKRVLEIGSGVGTFVITGHEAGIDIEGLEPEQELVSLSQARLLSEGIEAKIVHGVGEKLPYPDETFDIVSSFQVLEHVKDPAEVINESLRVTKRGGYVYFVIPSYQSFWEGHYGIFWWPNLHKLPWLMNLYLKLSGRNVSYAKTLNFITPPYVRKLISSSNFPVTLRELGYEVWKERLEKPAPAWGYTKKLYHLVSIARELHLLALLAFLGKKLEFYTPIIIICRRD